MGGQEWDCEGVGRRERVASIDAVLELGRRWRCFAFVIQTHAFLPAPSAEPAKANSISPFSFFYNPPKDESRGHPRLLLMRSLHVALQRKRQMPEGAHVRAYLLLKMHRADHRRPASIQMPGLQLPARKSATRPDVQKLQPSQADEPERDREE